MIQTDFETMTKKNHDILVYEAQGVKVLADQDNSRIFFRWNGFVRSFHYREALQQALQAAYNRQLSHWVWDLAGMSVLSAEDIRWTLEEWYPIWEKSHLEAVYVIEPQQPFGKISFKKMLTREVMEKMNMKFFLSEKMMETVLAKNDHDPTDNGDEGIENNE